MTQRPQSHQLEEKSRRAFLASLPAEWVYRVMTPDYGIDGLVEVFDSAGNATGQQFLVQLKATDVEEVEHSLRVRLSTRHLEYYRLLVLPVLLVQYHAATERLFAAWVSDRQHASTEAKSATVNMVLSDLWTRDRFPAVVAELSSLRAAIDRGSREQRIEQYYKQESLTNPADRAVGPPLECKRFAAGERVFHAVFDAGMVESESESYIFLKFDDDEFARKFLPDSSAELVKVLPKGK